VLTELKNRGVQELLVACVDGLTDSPDAINTAFPKARIQLCIVHMVLDLSTVTMTTGGIKGWVMDPYAVGNEIWVPVTFSLTMIRSRVLPAIYTS